MVTRRFLTRVAARLVLVAWILMPFSVAQADPVEIGLGLIIDKDVAERTITMEGGKVFHLAPETRLVNSKGAEISFSEVQVAPGGNGLFARVPAASARYEASVQGDRLVLHELEVGGGFVD